MAEAVDHVVSRRSALALGRRRDQTASVLVWLVLSAVGITRSCGRRFGGTRLGRSRRHLGAAGVGGVAPFAAAGLWGEQYGAGIVAAVAALWILPAAALAGVGYLVYLGLEWIAARVGLE